MATITNDPKSTFRLQKTVLSTGQQLANMAPVLPEYDPRTTLNYLHTVAPTRIPTAPSETPKIRYFGVGTRGFYNIDDDNKSKPNEVRNTNMGLYRPLPIRCVPLAEDLTTTERARYRMRVVEQDIAGNPIVSYYLKVIDYTDDRVKYMRRDPITGVQTPYVFDYGDLTPTPPTPPITGTVTANVELVNATVGMSMSLTNAEVIEAAMLRYGDPWYATISEIGLYSGFDATHSASDIAGVDFTYIEAMYSQLILHYTSAPGHNLSTPDSTLRISGVLGEDVLLVA